MRNKQSLRKADSIFGLILSVISLFYVYQSIKMPWNGISGGGILAAPGLLPLIISIVLTILGLVISITGFKEGGKITKKDIKMVFSKIKSEQGKRVLIMIGLFIIYAFVLVGNIPFFIATFIFLSSFMIIFSRKTKKIIIKCVIISFSTSFLITMIFGRIINIPLP